MVRTPRKMGWAETSGMRFGIFYEHQLPKTLE